MHAQPNDPDCSKEAIGGNHFGPVMVYMSKVDDATTADGSGSWFKIDEFGYDSSSKTWGTDLLNKNCGKREFKIPSKIPAGDYLVRAEAIALHTAGQTGGAQFYMSCYVSFSFSLTPSLCEQHSDNLPLASQDFRRRRGPAARRSQDSGSVQCHGSGNPRRYLGQLFQGVQDSRPSRN